MEHEDKDYWVFEKEFEEYVGGESQRVLNNYYDPFRGNGSVFENNVV